MKSAPSNRINIKSKNITAKLHSCAHIDMMRQPEMGTNARIRINWNGEIFLWCNSTKVLFVTQWWPSHICWMFSFFFTPFNIYTEPDSTVSLATIVNFWLLIGQRRQLLSLLMSRFKLSGQIIIIAHYNKTITPLHGTFHCRYLFAISLSHIQYNLVNKMTSSYN